MSAEFWGYFLVFCAGILVGRLVEAIKRSSIEYRRRHRNV